MSHNFYGGLHVSVYGIGGGNGDGVLYQGLILIVGECIGEGVTVEGKEVLKEEGRETVEVVGAERVIVDDGEVVEAEE